MEQNRKYLIEKNNRFFLHKIDLITKKEQSFNKIFVVQMSAYMQFAVRILILKTAENDFVLFDLVGINTKIIHSLIMENK